MPLINKLELTQLVAPVLDEAIANVAEQEFNRLRRITNDDVQVAENVKEALDSLINLQKGVEPEYNEWDALFYVTWYQPYQINLALTILQEVYEDAQQHPGPDFPLHIIDVGCGALAVQFAMAILATVYQREETDLTVNGVDPSEPMRKIGKTLWLEFWSNLSHHPELSDLSHTCDYMTNNCQLFDSLTSCCWSEVSYSRTNRYFECWLTAVHVIYESNKGTIKLNLEKLYAQYSPSVIIVTCPDFKCEIARSVTGEDFRYKNLNSDELTFQGQLRNTTEWRRCLVDRLPENPVNRVEGLLQGKRT